MRACHLGSWRVAIAPEPSSTWLTGRKSTCFVSPASSVGPWSAIRGCTTNSYSSIRSSSVNASGSVTPPTSSPAPGSRFSRRTASPLGCATAAGPPRVAAR
jgi:hypothetical protein